jgi:PAS domain S-box-containing protein
LLATALPCLQTTLPWQAALLAVHQRQGVTEARTLELIQPRGIGQTAAITRLQHSHEAIWALARLGALEDAEFALEECVRLLRAIPAAPLPARCHPVLISCCDDFRDGTLILLTDESQQEIVSNRDKLALLRDLLLRLASHDRIAREYDLYQRAMNAMGAVTYERNYQTREWFSVGQSVEHLLGLTRDEIACGGLREITEQVLVLHEPPGTDLSTAVRRAMDGQTHYWQTEMRIRRPDGAIRWISDNSVAILDLDGRPVGSHGILQDITEVKKRSILRDALLDLLPKLAVCEDLVEAASHAARAADQVTPWHSCFIGMLQPDQVHIECIHMTDLNDKGERVEYLDRRERIYRLNEEQQSLLDVPRLVLRTPEEMAAATLPTFGDEGRRSASLIFVPMRTTGGVTLGMLSVQSYDFNAFSQQDLLNLTILAGASAETMRRLQVESDRRRLEEARRHAERLDSLGLMACGIAHDFNNQLSTVLGNVGLLLIEAGDGSSNRAALREVEGAALRMRDLTRQIMAFAGQTELDRRSLRLAPLLDQLSANVRSLAAPHGVGLLTQHADSSMTVQGDQQLLHHLLMSVMVNAVEAMRENKGTIKLRSEERLLSEADLNHLAWRDELRPGRFVAIVVEDDGPGMTPAVAQRAFEPFFTTNTASRGLGLSTALGIARAHGGFIQLDSEAGKGTRVTVFLPLVVTPEPASTETGKPQQEVPRAPSAPQAHRGAILVVDDEPAVLEVVSRLLRRFGYSVLPSPNGENAIQLLEASPAAVSAALIDVRMPILDGPSLARRLRALRHDLPIVMMSGYADESAILSLEEIGVQGFLRKPFMPAELRDIIQQALAT